MTNEQAEIQQAAREEFRRQLVTYMPDLKPHELDKLLDDARVSIGDWAAWHISQSEEERKRVQELERALGEAISWIYYAPESVILELRAALSSTLASAEREVKG